MNATKEYEEGYKAWLDGKKSVKDNPYAGLCSAEPESKQAADWYAGQYAASTQAYNAAQNKIRSLSGLPPYTQE